MTSRQLRQCNHPQNEVKERPSFIKTNFAGEMSFSDYITHSSEPADGALLFPGALRSPEGCLLYIALIFGISTSIMTLISVIITIATTGIIIILSIIILISSLLSVFIRKLLIAPNIFMPSASPSSLSKLPINWGEWGIGEEMGGERTF